MKSQHKLGIQLLVMAALLAAALWGIEVVSTRALAARHLLSENPLSVQPAQSATAEGKRLAHVDGCFGCHGAQLTGQVIYSDWLGTRIVAPNLTRLAPVETDTELAAAIRYGIGRDGTSLISMPSAQFIKSSDSDIAAVIAYLHSLLSKPDTAGKTSLGLKGRAMVAMGLLPVETDLVDDLSRGPVQTPVAPAALGLYLTRAHCSACHGDDLSGRTAEGSPSLRVSIVHYSPQSFAHFFRTGEGQIGHGTATMTRMIRSRFQYLTPAEVQAIYLYLKSGSGVPLPQSGE